MTVRGRAGLRMAAVVLPVAVTAAAVAVRELMANTSVALLLVLVVVAIATGGDRVAGLLAALASAAAFDFFLTVPYLTFAILGRDDVETAVLLLAIGVAVTEISLWGRRHRARTRRVQGYLADVATAARMAADGTPTGALVAEVETRIAELLDLDAIRYEGAEEPATGDRPVLQRDGLIHWNGQMLDTPRRGLPYMDVIELPAGRDAADGRFLLTASTRLRRPSLEQLLVAVTLAEQVTRTRVER